MSRIAVLIHNDFEDAEYRVPHDKLTADGHELRVAGPAVDEDYVGKRDEGRRVKPDLSLGGPRSR
ncbi:MAG: DJ-1/PfpI family protein [Acidimicrobiia bacterium]|nr:DJ-1/PfpI family protein [Acidimicrobiia bacterium]